MERIILLLLLAFILCGCEVEAIVDSKHESILQIDAVMYSGEKLSNINIKRTVNAPGKSSFVIDSTQIFVSGANIELLLNGVLINVKEVKAGLYQPQSEVVVEQGDEIKISVQKDNMRASATANVPIYGLDNVDFQLSSDTVEVTVAYPFNNKLNDEIGEYEIKILDTLWFGYGTFHVEISDFPDYLVTQIYSNLDSVWSNGINHNSFDPSYYDFSSYGNSYLIPYRKDELVDVLTISHELDSYLILKDDYEQILLTPQELSIGYNFLIPEDVYLDYIDVKNNEWAPITITNVEGGVGLFIGCAKLSGEYSEEVVIQKSEFQIDPSKLGEY